MEKRGIVDEHTPDVQDRLSKRAATQTPETKAAALDDDTTRRLSQTAAAALTKRKQA